MKFLTIAASAALLALSLSAAPAQATSAEMQERFNCKWRVLAGPWVSQNTKPAARIKARKQAFGEIKQKSSPRGEFSVRGREFVKSKNMEVRLENGADGTYKAVAHLDVFICDEGYKREVNR